MNNHKLQQQAMAKIQRVLDLHGLKEREINFYIDDITYNIVNKPDEIIKQTDKEVLESFFEWKRNR